MSAPDSAQRGLLAVDVGSSRIKLGYFASAAFCGSEAPASDLLIATPQLPVPSETASVVHRQASPQQWQNEVTSWLEAWLRSEDRCALASVEPNVARQLIETSLAPWRGRLTQLTAPALPIEARVEQPDQVGVDRLLNAIAARRLSEPRRAQIIIDVGTAITVDLVSSDGAFEGGSILPGPFTAASALHRATARLPELDPALCEALPPALGKSTAAAIRAGVCWGIAGGVQEIVRRLALQQPGAPQVLLTGGDAPWLAALLAEGLPDLRRVDHLTLAGIRLVAEQLA